MSTLKFGSHSHLRLVAVGASLVTLSSLSFGQHGVANSWNNSDVQITNDSGYSTGVVGRNMGVDSRNRIHVVYTYQSGSAFDVYYTRSIDGGLNWSQPRDIVNSPLPAYSPNIAIGPDDTLHITWVDRRAGGNARVYYARSFDAGMNWETPRDLSGSAPYNAASAVISVDLRNRVHVAWHIGNPDSQQEIAQVFYTRSLEGGSVFEAPRMLNTNSTRHAAFPRFNVVGTTGDVIAIAWRDNRRAPDWDTYLAVSNNGGQTFVERVGRATPMRDWDPESIVDRRGVIHLSYMTYRPNTITIDYIRSGDLGQTWSQEITLSEARSRFPFWVPDHRHGTLWLFWKDERDSDPLPTQNLRADIVCKFSNDGGRSWSRMEFVTDLGDVEVKFPCPVGGLDGRIYTLWSDRRASPTSEQIYFKARKPLGDVNLDGCVNDEDLLAILFAFGSNTDSDSAEDINGDGQVDDLDLLIVSFFFGVGCR